MGRGSQFVLRLAQSLIGKEGRYLIIRMRFSGNTWRDTGLNFTIKSIWI